MHLFKTAAKQKQRYKPVLLIVTVSFSINFKISSQCIEANNSARFAFTTDRKQKNKLIVDYTFLDTRTHRTKTKFYLCNPNKFYYDLNSSNIRSNN